MPCGAGGSKYGTRDGRGVFRERVRDHLTRAGWAVEEGPVLRGAGPPLKADFRRMNKPPDAQACR